MRKLLIAFGLVALLAGSAPQVYAQDPVETTVNTSTEVPAVVVPNSDTVVVTDDSSIVLPWGTWIGAIGDLVTNYAMPLLLTVASGVLALMPSYARIIIGTFLTEANLKKAIQYAVNQVEGAARDKVLTIDVGSKVVAEAVQYFIDSVPGWLIKFAGGREQITQKVIARIEFEPKADGAAIAKAVRFPRYPMDK